MMGIHKPGMGTPRKAATAVSVFERTAQCRRDVPGLSPDMERVTVTILSDGYYTGITSEAFGGLDGDDRAIVEITTRTVVSAMQRLRDMNHHLVAFGRARRDDAAP